VDGLTDLIKHYKINVPVRNVCEYVADALVLAHASLRHEEMPVYLKGRKVLVVDDDQDVVAYLCALLKDNGFETISATSGAEGLRLAKDQKPDLITLDISMPGRSGIEVFTKLRSEAGSAAIPVCVVTGAIDFRQLMYHRNVPPPDGYLEKPIAPDLLLMTVRRILEVKHRQAQMPAS